ncbi:MAG: tetratricopeptide repeat protein [Oxalobacter sp.]|nr:tetratricopeptide repeat protein [Oxalobacter sp.]
MATMKPGKKRAHMQQAQHHWERALRFHQKQQLDAALASYGEAIRLNRDFAEAYANRGVLFMLRGENEQALADYDQSITLKPDFFNAYANRGGLLMQLGQSEKALADLNRAIALKPDFAQAYAKRGVLFVQAGKKEQALDDFNQAITLDPDYAEAYSDRGSLFMDLGREDAALADYNWAIILKPDFYNAYVNRGNLLVSMRNFKAAVESYEQALLLNPASASAYEGIGRAFMGNGQLDIAQEYYEKARELDSDMVAAHCNYADLLYEVNRFDEAMAEWGKAIALDPNCYSAYFNNALLLMLYGRFEEGLPLYEFRFKVNKPGPDELRFPGKVWLGEESLQGKTILLYHEQGLGDTIQFCRYARLVSARGAKVIMHVQAPLAALLKNLEGVDEFIVGPRSPDDVLPAFDVCCPMMSLPLALKTTLETIPGETPYLTADPEKTAFWETRLGRKTKPRVGLVWSGNPAYKNDHRRSILLAQLLPYLPDNCDYISLQKPLADMDRAIFDNRPELKHYEDELNDFSDTAALCSLMDVVISVDTAVAHMSGALGRPTWIMLPFNPDWRWLLERRDSPWYPDVRLYRQNQPGNWDGVCEAVRSDLLGLGNSGVA